DLYAHGRRGRNRAVRWGQGPEGSPPGGGVWSRRRAERVARLGHGSPRGGGRGTDAGAVAHPLGRPLRDRRSPGDSGRGGRKQSSRAPPSPAGGPDRPDGKLDRPGGRAPPSPEDLRPSRGYRSSGPAASQPNGVPEGRTPGADPPRRNARGAGDPGLSQPAVRSSLHVRSPRQRAGREDGRTVGGPPLTVESSYTRQIAGERR